MTATKYLFVAFAALLPHAFAQTCANINPAVTPKWASGYSGKVLLNGLKTPRGIATDDQGNLLIVESGGAGIRWVQLTDGGGSNVCVKTSKQIITDTSLNHGIAFSSDYKILFVSSISNVFSYSYDSTTGAATNKKTLITGMNGQDHYTRTLMTSPKNPDLLLVAHGSNSNIDTATTGASSGRSQARTWKISALQSGSSVAYTSGDLFGMGLRNSVGWAEHPVTGGVFSVENSCDDMTKSGKDIHQTNPAEELNYHGVISNTSAVERGANYGYPACFTAWNPSIIPSPAGLKVGQQFLIDNPSGASAESDCAKRIAPVLPLPPHTAPLDIKFNAAGTAAYVTYHGSWDRQPPDGYRLGKITFDATTGMPKEPPTSTTASVNIMENPNVGSCPNNCFRPVGVTWDKNMTRLFMTSDSTNEVWVISGTLT